MIAMNLAMQTRNVPIPASLSLCLSAPVAVGASRTRRENPRPVLVGQFARGATVSALNPTEVAIAQAAPAPVAAPKRYRTV